MLPYCTDPYAIWLPKTAMLFFDNGLPLSAGKQMVYISVIVPQEQKNVGQSLKM
jgi:hypothetical protein